MKIQDLIQKKLDELNLNNYQVSQKTGIPYSSVRDFLRPSDRVDLVKLGKVCGIIGITPWSLFRELHAEKLEQIKLAEQEKGGE
jgi:hypothetical protein